MARTRRTTMVVRIAAVALGLAFLAGALGWHLSGGRWYAVQTPSMGRAAPVGTLLLTRPVDIADVHVGDFITFRAPTSGEVFSHRVVAVTTAGLKTRGDINAIADPWIVTAKDLIGEVTARWWGCGWLLRAVPLVLFVAALVWLLTMFVRPALRSPLRLVGVSISFAAVAFWLRPWTGLIKLGSTFQDGQLRLRAVSTGILPIRVADSRGGPPVRLVSGQVGNVSVTKRSPGGAYGLSAHLGLTFWWWVAVVAVCLLPVLWTSLVGLEAGDPPPARDVLADDQPYWPAHAVVEQPDKVAGLREFAWSG